MSTPFAHFEKPPTASKKFLAYFVSDMSWTILLAYGIYHRDDVLFTTSILFTMVLVKGFVATGFLLGQSYVDKFVRIAEIAAHAPQTLTSSVTATDSTSTVSVTNTAVVTDPALSNPVDSSTPETTDPKV